MGAIKSQDDFFELESHDKRLDTKCHACGRVLGNYFAARVNHGRAHVRKHQAVELLDADGFIAFQLRK
jgi:hypothetical protein